MRTTSYDRSRSAPSDVLLPLCTVFLLACAAIVFTSGVTRAQGVTSPYLQLVWRYRAGDTQRAVVDAAALPTGGLRTRVLRDLGSHVCETLGGTPDCERLRDRQPDVYRGRITPILRAAVPAAFLLHLHASSVLTFSGDGKLGDAHREVARLLIDRIAPVEAQLDPAAAAALREVRRRAMLLFAWLLQSDLLVDAVGEFVRDALEAFPGDGELLLASGGVEETLARPMYLEQRYALRSAIAPASGGRRGWMDRERGFRLQRAADLFRAALAGPAPPAEARIRLGRVLFLQGRMDEARAAFARLAADADADAWTRYLGALFTAGLEEKAGAPRAARRWYETALRAWPGGQVARVSLARLVARDGERAAAAALIAKLPSDPALDKQGDPWSWYFLGQAWRLERGFIALREDVRR